MRFGSEKYVDTLGIQVEELQSIQMLRGTRFNDIFNSNYISMSFDKIYVVECT